MLSKETLEILVGSTLLFSSWLIIFLVVIGIINPPTPELTILTSLLCYMFSVIGLALASHGVVVRVVAKKKRKVLE
ncbi:MAG: hypothetical protein QW721_01625 [Desulfurococcaceae archaeon]